jgi:hypothetical protein
MADREDAWARFRKRDEEKKKPGGSKGALALSTEAGSEKSIAVEDQDLDTLFLQVPNLMEHLNNLYNMYIAGVEKRPPIEKRKLLDRIKNAIVDAPKPTASSRFKSSVLTAQIQTGCEKWDKLLRALELGNLKRRRGEE